jgi:hypothetical protein
MKMRLQSDATQPSFFSLFRMPFVPKQAASVTSVGMLDECCGCLAHWIFQVMRTGACNNDFYFIFFTAWINETFWIYFVWTAAKHHAREVCPGA